MTDDKYEYTGRRKHGTIIGHPTQGPWNKAEFHRSQVLRMLPQNKEGRRGLLCVFGVGDGTALDLNAMLDRFHEVHLVDIDEQAIEKAVESQSVAGNPRVRRWNVDVTGVHNLFNQYAAQPDAGLLDEIRQKIIAWQIPELGQFECVLSSSLLSSLTRHVAKCFGDDIEKMAEPMLMIRNQHIAKIIGHTEPDGHAILINKFVTSETLPELAAAPDELSDLIRTAIENNNFYPGTSPMAIGAVLRSPEIEQFLEAIDIAATWIHEEANKHSACMAFRLQRVSAST